MARIRSIKPEFCTSEQVVGCSRDARLLFVSMWLFCDDAGIHPASLKRLKMECFPADDVGDEELLTWVNELLRARLLGRFTAGALEYWAVTGWEKHQRIDRPSYKYPTWEQLSFDEHSPNDVREFAEVPTPPRRTVSVSNRGDVVEDSANARRTPPPGVEWKGEGVEALARAKALATGRSRSTPAKRSSKAKAPPPTEALGGGDGSLAVDKSETAELSVFGSDPPPGAEELVLTGEQHTGNGNGEDKTPLQRSCAATWAAYAAAYERRWGVEPLRSTIANAHILAFCKTVPQDEAPDIAAFFLLSNNAFYVSRKHDLSALRRNAAGLRTEWATGRQGTQSEARSGDKTAAIGGVFQKLIDEGRRLAAEEEQRKLHAAQA